MTASTAEPKRIQFLRFNGYPLPPNARLVTRPGRYGNPFAIRKVATGFQIVDLGDRSRTLREEPYVAPSKLLASVMAVRLFELHTGPMGIYEYDADALERLRADLGGRDLACSCPLVNEHGDLWPCHANWLLRLANPGGAW